MEEKKSLSPVFEHHFVLNALSGQKTFGQMKKDFWYLDKKLYSYQVKAGVSTRKRTVKICDFIVGEEPISLLNIFESFKGLWGRKWLSQSQVVKICKHFKSELKTDDYGNHFVCKINEFKEINEENPLNDLMFLAIYLDSDGDIRIHKKSPELVAAKRTQGFPFRVILPAK